MSTDEQYDANPADFDLSAWVRGVHRNVKTVRVYGRPDIEDDIARLRDQLAGMRDDGGERGMDEASPATVRAQIETLTRELEASAVNFKVEGRSSTYLKGLEAELEKKGVNRESPDFVLHLTVDQVIEPSGLTFDDLKILADTIEPQVMKVIGACFDVNSKAPRVDPPFSPASSPAQRTRRS